MFANRQAGSGGLSINTNTANSAAGSTGQPPKSGGLFGSVQQPKPAGSLFGAATTTSQPQNSLFGTANPSQGGGLFGSNTNTSQQGNGLFGTPTVTQSGGLFGSSTTAPQAQQEPSFSGGSLFGGQVSINQQTQGGGLFGGSYTQQGGGMFGQPTQQQNPNVFGSTSTQQTQPQQQSGGLFGSLGQTQPQPQNSQIKSFPNFGSSTLQIQNQLQPQQQQPQLQQQAPSIFTNSIGQLSQQQQTVPGVRISINELRPTTRFNDLHEELQRVIENIDNFILEQMKHQSDCERAISGDNGVIESFVPVPREVHDAQTTLDAVQQALENDAQAAAQIKTSNRIDHSDAKLSFRAVSTLRMPQQFQQSGFRHTTSASYVTAPSLLDDEGDGAATDLISYFSRQAGEISKTFYDYQGRLSEIDTYLNGMEVGMVDQMQQLIFLSGHDGNQKTVEDQVKELATVLKEMQTGIGGVASKIGSTREKVHEVVLGEEYDRFGIQTSRRYG